MPAIYERLKRQLASRGQKNAAGMAMAILKKRGILTGKGELTAKGRKRQALGNDGRAKDRAAKRSGRSPKDYKYNPKTNRATLKRKK